MFTKWFQKTFTRSSLKAASPPVPFLMVSIIAAGIAIASSAQVTCPACQGAGTLKTAQGLDAQITDIKQTDRHVPAGCCDNPIAEYAYLVTVSVTNPGATTISGNLTINFYNPGDSALQADEKEVGFSTLEVEVPAGATKTYKPTCFLMQFGAMLEKPHRAAINSDALKAEMDIPCALCQGRGKIACFDWLEGRAK
jgi:hypothetical protein